MEQNSQNAAFYPPAFHPSYQHAFNLPHERAEDSSAFLPSEYLAPSALSSAAQGFHTSDSVQGLDYGKPHEDTDACNMGTVGATTKTNGDNFFQDFEGVRDRLSQLENVVQRLDCSIEGLKRTERERHEDTNDKLARLELLIKEVLTGVQHLSENYKLDGAISHMSKLQVVDEKASVVEEMKVPLVDRQHPNESHSHVEPSDTSEHMNHVCGRPLSSHYSEAPPPPRSPNHSASQSPNSLAPHNMLPPPPNMNEPGKPISRHPFPSPPHRHFSVPPSSGQPLPPHHAMQVPPLPPFSSQAQAQQLPPSPPLPQGVPNSIVEANSYGHMQLHQQYTEAPRPLSSSYPELSQYYGGGARQEVPHLPPQYSSSGTQVYEPPAGMVGATPVYVPPPYGQSWLQSSPAVSTYETTGYNNPPSYRAAQPRPPSGGGANRSRLPRAQSLPGSDGMPVGFAPASHQQINEVTEKVTAMGFSKEQVRAVVQGLTDIGQPVDMNAVLYKLMNKGEQPQSQRGWYGQG